MNFVTSRPPTNVPRNVGLRWCVGIAAGAPVRNGWQHWNEHVFVAIAMDLGSAPLGWAPPRAKRRRPKYTAPKYVAQFPGIGPAIGRSVDVSHRCRCDLGERTSELIGHNICLSP